MLVFSRCAPPQVPQTISARYPQAHNLQAFSYTPSFYSYTSALAYRYLFIKMTTEDEKISASATPVGELGLQPTRSVTIPRDLFEKMYLNPPTKVSGDLRRTFANPTPLYDYLFFVKCCICILS